MLGNEPHEPWLAPPDRHQPSTRSRSAPDTQGKETRGQQWPPRTKGAPRRAHSSRHAKGNWIMCSATGEICLLTYSALIQIGRKHIPTTDGWTKLPTVVEPEPPSWNQEQSSRKANSTRQAWLISLLLYVTTVSRTNQSCLTHTMMHIRNTPNSLSGQASRLAACKQSHGQPSQRECGRV